MARLFENILEQAKLFQISEEEVVDTETGEVLNIQYLDELKLEEAEIKKYLGQTFVELGVDIEAHKAQETKHKEARQRLEKRRDSLKNYLDICCGGQPFEADDKSVKISYRKSSSVNIVALEDVPDEYKTEEITIKADKMAIKKAIKDLGSVAGCELIESNNISIK